MGARLGDDRPLGPGSLANTGDHGPRDHHDCRPQFARFHSIFESDLSILHSPNFILQSPQHSVFVVYTLIPWVGVTAVGYGLGRIYDWTSRSRRTFLLRAGLVLIAAFVVLRGVSVYGDPLRWTMQKSVLFTALSFLNTCKYPPSLLFLLMTLGPALVLLCVVERKTPELLRPALVFGRVPMFYFLLHIPLVHLISVGACYARYGHVHWMFESPPISDLGKGMCSVRKCRRRVLTNRKRIADTYWLTLAVDNFLL
jgi:hypothetical protein